MREYLQDCREAARDLENEAIYICGPTGVQNDLIGYYLTEHMKTDCHAFGDWSSVKINLPANDPPVMVLFDHSSRDLNEFLSDVTANAESVFACTKSILFNLPRDTPVKGYVKSGICGVFYSDDSLELIQKGVIRVHQGSSWFSKKELLRCILYEDCGACDEVARVGLTKREVEILMLIGDGYDNNEISDKLCVSFHTVKAHVSNIYKKISINNRVQAALWCREYMS